MTSGGPTGWTGVIPPSLSAATDPSAAQSFQVSVNTFAQRLWEETQREQAAIIGAGGADVFTKRMVERASERSLNPLDVKPQRSWLGLALHLLTILVASFAGVSGNFLHEDWGKLLFPVSIVGALVLGAVTYWKAGTL